MDVLVVQGFLFGVIPEYPGKLAENAYFYMFLANHTNANNVTRSTPPISTGVGSPALQPCAAACQPF